MAEETSISFGGTDVIEVGMPLDEVKQLVQEGVRRGALVELEDTRGERLFFNPTQVKIIQSMPAPPPNDVEGEHG